MEVPDIFEQTIHHISMGKALEQWRWKCRMFWNTLSISTPSVKHQILKMEVQDFLEKFIYHISKGKAVEN